MKTVKVRKKVKIFLESVVKTVFYVKRAPSISYVGSLTIPLLQGICLNLMTWSLSVELKTVLHWRPEYPAIFTNFGLFANHSFGYFLSLEILVGFTGSSTMLRVTSVCCWPIQQTFWATTHSLYF